MVSGNKNFLRNNEGEGMSDVLRKIVDNLPQTGPTPKINAQREMLISTLFPESYITRLRQNGINIENLSSMLSTNKLEISLVIKYPNVERQIMVYYRKGKLAIIKITTGMMQGEKVLREEPLPNSIDQARERIQQLVEELSEGLN